MTQPAVTVQPGVRFGRPHIRGRETAALAGQYWAGDPVELLMQEYHVTRHEVLLALWFEGTHGAYRDRWEGWAAQAGVGLSRGELDMRLPLDRNGEA